MKEMETSGKKKPETPKSNNQTGQDKNFTADAFNNLAKTLAKIEVNKFNGNPDEDVELWIFSLERHFKKIALEDEEKIDLAVDYMRGGALSTYRSMDDWSVSSWENFKVTLFSAYQPQNLQILLRMKIKYLRQTGPIQSYINEFNKLLYPIKNMSEEDKIITFIDGLRDQTRARVSFEEPTSLGKAKELAVKYETYYGIEWKGNSCLDNYPNSKRNKHQGVWNNPVQKATLNASYNENFSSVPTQSRVAAPHPGLSNGTSGASPNYVPAPNPDWRSQPHQGATHPNAAAKDSHEFPNINNYSTGHLANGPRNYGNSNKSGCSFAAVMVILQRIAAKKTADSNK